MTAAAPDYAELIERLEKVEPDTPGEGVTRYYRNPDGPEAAAALRTLLSRAFQNEELVPAPPVIHARFETVDETIPMAGTTDAPVKRVEQNDDGSYTVVIDHWPQPIGWQPIETAPADGRVILVYEARSACPIHLRPADGDWWRKQGVGPSHWMPLPTPPTAGGGND